MDSLESKLDAIKAVYSEQLSYAKHHESLREKTTQIILVISGAVISIANIDGIQLDPLLFGCVLIVLGLFGAMLCRKHYSKHQEHYDQAQVLQRKLFDLGGAKNEWKEVKAKRDEVRRKNRWLGKVRLNTLWVLLNVLVAVSGLYMIFG
jgi:hypothetical protein